jgi:2-methylcitrate dehydratase PrpD
MNVEPSSTTGATRALLRFVGALRWEELGAEVKAAARRHFLDTLGAIIAGSAGDVCLRAEGVLASLRAGGKVPVPGRARPADPLDAAFLAGTAGHGIELDDGYRQGSVHLGVAVIPALIGASHCLEDGAPVDGKAFLEALVAGYECIAHVAAHVHPALRSRGFHPTGAVGVLGAAMAAGKLLKLDEPRLSHALGLAASAAAGLFAFLGGGGDVKRLHAGHAAREGLMAALLARDGMLGPPDALEARDGFFQAFSSIPADRVFCMPPDRPFALPDCYVKPYACCRHLQPALEALLQLRREHRFDGSQIAAMRVATYVIAAAHAKTGFDDFASAQLSFPYIMALGATFDTIEQAHFASEVRSDPRIAALSRKLVVQVDPELDRTYPDLRPARVTVDLVSGETYSLYRPEALGSRLVPLDDDALHDKFRSLAGPVLGSERTNKLAETVWRADSLSDITQLIAATGAPAKTSQ